MKASGILFLILNISFATAFITCGGNCNTDSDCQSYLGNPCTFCEQGQCSPMCGVGCSTSADCAGGGNPCTLCSDRRVCINPVPQCGSFCGGYNGACQFNTGQCAGSLEQCCTCNPGNYTLGCGNYTTSPVTCGTKCVSSSDCSKATGGCVYCVNNACTSQSSLCGTICSGSGQCQSDAKCTQCVGYYCSQPVSCGQNCISSGQCQNNPGSCKACIGTLCANYEPCGGACGSDDWCNPHSSCPVCNHVAKCASSFEHEQWLQTATKEDLAEWKFKMEWVTEQANNAANRKYMRLLNAQG